MGYRGTPAITLKLHPQDLRKGQRKYFGGKKRVFDKNFGAIMKQELDFFYNNIRL